MGSAALQFLVVVEELEFAFDDVDVVVHVELHHLVQPVEAQVRIHKPAIRKIQFDISIKVHSVCTSAKLGLLFM